MQETKISNEQYLEVLNEGCPICGSVKLAPYELEDGFGMVCSQCGEETQHKHKHKQEDKSENSN